MRCYVDSSVVLRYLLVQDTSLEKIEEYDQTGSSELLLIECSRVIQRYRLENRLNDEQLAEIQSILSEIVDSLYVFELNSQIKQRAAQAFPTIISTLDAFHLTTAFVWQKQDNSPFVLFTFDKQMKLCAQAMGIHTIP